MTLQDAFDLYAYALTERIKRKLLRFAVVNAANDNSCGAIAALLERGPRWPGARR